MTSAAPQGLMEMPLHTFPSNPQLLSGAKRFSDAIGSARLVGICSIGSEKHLKVPQSFLNVSLKVEEVILTLKKNREGNIKV